MGPQIVNISIIVHISIWLKSGTVVRKIIILNDNHPFYYGWVSIKRQIIIVIGGKKEEEIDTCNVLGSKEGSF